MDSKFILEKSTTVGGGELKCRPGRSVHCDARVPVLERNGPMPAYTNGPVPYKCSPDGGSPVEVKSPRTCFKGNGISPGGRISLDMEKVSVFSGEIHPKVRRVKTAKGFTATCVSSCHIPLLCVYGLNMRIGSPQGTYRSVACALVASITPLERTFGPESVTVFQKRAVNVRPQVIA